MAKGEIAADVDFLDVVLRLDVAGQRSKILREVGFCHRPLAAAQEQRIVRHQRQDRFEVTGRRGALPAIDDIADFFFVAVHASIINRCGASRSCSASRWLLAALRPSRTRSPSAMENGAAMAAAYRSPIPDAISQPDAVMGNFQSRRSGPTERLTSMEPIASRPARSRSILRRRRIFRARLLVGR